LAILAVILLPGQSLKTAGSAAPSLNAEGYFWLGVDTIATGYIAPTGVTSTGFDDRLFILERPGRIKIYEDGQLLVPFLDITDRVGSLGSWEQGLLGLAFHPDYDSNGFFFVNYTNLEGDNQISRFKVSDINPDAADPDSEAFVLTIPQPTVIHNGGGLAFGPDGYLYISVGDGGWLSDPENQAQNTQLLLGKILRLNVSTGGAPPYYTIPPDNPYVGDPDTADEIWALGFRNPWRITFDRQTGDLYIGDVGNFRQEEIDFQPGGDPGGQNYGWRCYEGNLPFITTGCGPISQYTFPIYAYNQDPGCAVTGGYVYRGSQYPFLTGYYVFGDLCSGELWTLHQSSPGIWDPIWRGTEETTNISSFGESSDGELFAVDYTYGRLYAVTAELIENINFSPLAPYNPILETPTPPSPGPDLVVTDLTIVPISPIAGETAEILVTVQNQGIRPVEPGNNFFIDFYVDTIPVPYAPGDIFWGAQGSQFGVGQSRTFTHDFSFTAGVHDLYIQVDTDQSVEEMDETNNIFGPKVITVQPP
jgi:glucose/arabinose dehydrogenase